MPLDPVPPETSHSSTRQSAPAASHPVRKWLGIGAGVLVAAALIAWLTQYLLVGQYFISTDDAYVAADTSMVAAKVSGYVTAVPVRENQLVRAGDVLAVIDPRDYQTALAAARADVLAARAAMASDAAQLSLQQAKIQAAQAAVTGDEARVDFAVQNQRRYARLSTTGASPVQTADQATTDLATARAQLAADQAALLGAQRSVDVLNAALAQAGASLAQAQAHADQAALDLSHTQIRAPFDGQIGNKTVAVGDYLQAGTQLMAIVPITQVFVTANYKETQITRMAPGQKVRIAVDGYPALKVTGVVDSISPASGQEFALLPPDNATGNFTKIVQRVPVKILINLTPDLVGKLRPGMSVEPDIDTRAH
jgi:membrane fusion protein (multidrug efflux system)